MQLDGSKIVPKGKVEFGLAVDEFQMGGIFMQNWGRNVRKLGCSGRLFKGLTLMQGGVLSTLVFCYDLRWRVQYSRENFESQSFVSS